MEQKQIEALFKDPGLMDRRNIRIEIKEQVTSTNDLLKEAAAEGEPEGLVLVALEQTKGKGRLGRSFYSPRESGIYLSLLLRPSISAEDALLLTTSAAVAMAEAIEDIGGRQIGIKWVNDIYCRGKKVVGILTESGFRLGEEAQEKNREPRLDYAVVGIGVNLWEPEGGYPPELQSIAGAIFPYEERPDSFEERDRIRIRLVAAFLERYFEIYEELPGKGFMESYRKKSLLTGKMVQLRTPGHEVIDTPAVKVLGIGDEAQLIVQDQSGHVRYLSTGEVSVTEKI